MSVEAKKGKDLIFDIINYIMIFAFTILCFYPFYYIFLYSISDPTQVVIKGIHLLPVEPTLVTYKAFFKNNDIFQALFISASRAIVGMLVTVACSSFFAYLVSKREMPFRRIVYRFAIITMYVNAGLIPWYITMKDLGLKNSFLLYVLPTSIGAFYVVLFKTYIEQLPPALEESAGIDGAGYFTIFLKIVFPISKPIAATIAIFSAVGQWNSWQDNLYLVSKKSLMTLQLLLYNYLASSAATGLAGGVTQAAAAGQRAASPMSIKMAMCMITVLPILIVYPVLQKYFVKGIMLGAVKG